MQNDDSKTIPADGSVNSTRQSILNKLNAWLRLAVLAFSLATGIASIHHNPNDNNALELARLLLHTVPQVVRVVKTLKR